MTNPRFSALAHARAATTAQLKQEVADFEAANPKRVVITFPWPPPKVFPNRIRGQHWRVSHPAIKAFKSVCAGVCYEAGLHLKKHSLVAHGLKLRLTYVFNPPDRRRRDRDGMNGATKAMQDAIALVVGVDDYYFVPKYDIGEVGAGNVVVTIEAAE